ncbi:MAG TPA: transmembrane 220 family protein [Ohtaekwangia sp.]|nr:transmembrane 220 family protein [Ohtaekwangia sp.]
MKILNFILCVLFLVFAFVQVNDPDPFIWIIIYGIMAVLAVMAMFNYFQRKLLIALLIIYAAYSMVYVDGVIEWFRQDDKAVIFDDVAKMRAPFIEYSREFLGLWICNLVLIFYLIKSRKQSA